MRDFVNRKARLLQPSGIRKFFNIVNETPGAISLGVGEPDFVTPWQVREAAIDSLRRGRTQYTANRGLSALLDLVARYLEERFSLSFDPAHILLTVGASEGIDLLLRACLNEGDEVLIPDPAYVSYAPAALMSDGVPVAVECREENGFIPSAEALEAAVSPRAKMLILTYPNNPTGGIADRAALEPIARFAEKHDLLVVSDEIYAELTYGRRHFSFAALPGMKERTAYVGGFSKAFAMTGWRLGFVCAPLAVDEAIFKIHQYTALCAPAVAQYAAVAALKEGLSDGFASVEEMRESYDRRRRFVLHALRESGLSCFEPLGAFYAFPSVRASGLDGEAFASRLLAEKKVAVVPGGAFGSFGKNNVRISYASGMSALMEAMERIADFIHDMQ